MTTTDGCRTCGGQAVAIGCGDRQLVRIRELLRLRASEDGVSVLVSSQHLDEVARMADRIVVLHHGRILGGLDPHGADVEHQFFQRILRADRAEQRPR